MVQAIDEFWDMEAWSVSKPGSAFFPAAVVAVLVHIQCTGRSLPSEY